MKKTLFLLAIGFGCLFLTSCARGYGCPYTTETKVINTPDEVETITLLSDESEASKTAITAK